MFNHIQLLSLKESMFCYEVYFIASTTHCIRKLAVPPPPPSLTGLYNLSSGFQDYFSLNCGL